MTIIISDTGPLIVFSKTGQLFLLKELFGEVLIPQAVYSELQMNTKYKETDSLLQAFEEGWIKVATINKKPSNVLTNTLDIGEAEAITLSKELNYPLLIDEKKGRKVASKENIKIIGTVGILIIAKNKNIIGSVKLSMNKMQESGYRISQKLYERALMLSHENGN